jgi:hypothetical protein
VKPAVNNCQNTQLSLARELGRASYRTLRVPTLRNAAMMSKKATALRKTTASKKPGGFFVRKQHALPLEGLNGTE